jgi:hypothetical protein
MYPIRFGQWNWSIWWRLRSIRDVIRWICGRPWQCQELRNLCCRWSVPERSGRGSWSKRVHASCKKYCICGLWIVYRWPLDPVTRPREAQPMADGGVARERRYWLRVHWETTAFGDDAGIVWWSRWNLTWTCPTSIRGRHTRLAQVRIVDGFGQKDGAAHRRRWGRPVQRPLVFPSKPAECAYFWEEGWKS